MIIDKFPVSSYYSSMLKANVSTLKNNLSRYLQKVRRGQSVEVLDRDQPVARLVPVGLPDERHDEWVDHLARLDLIRCGAMKGNRKILKTPPPGKTSAHVLEALLEERRGER